MFGQRKRRRARLMQEPTPESWEKILRRRVPYVFLLEEPDRANCSAR